MNNTLHTLMKEVSTSKKHRVEYLTDGPYTCCVIYTKKGLKWERSTWAFAKCNPNYDECNLERGKEISLARAGKHLYGF